MSTNPPARLRWRWNTDPMMFGGRPYHPIAPEFLKLPDGVHVMTHRIISVDRDSGAPILDTSAGCGGVQEVTVQAKTWPLCTREGTVVLVPHAEEWPRIERELHLFIEREKMTHVYGLTEVKRDDGFVDVQVRGVCFKPEPRARAAFLSNGTHEVPVDDHTPKPPMNHYIPPLDLAGVDHVYNVAIATMVTRKAVDALTGIEKSTRKRVVVFTDDEVDTLMSAVIRDRGIAQGEVDRLREHGRDAMEQMREEEAELDRLASIEAKLRAKLS